MRTEKREDPLVDMGYEIRDINLKAIRNATIGFFLFAIGSFAVGYWIYAVMNPAFNGDYLSAKDRRRIPPSPYPLLQNNLTAKTDIMALRQAESVQLKSTGYNDPTHESVHIPIDRAMDLIATRGISPTGNDVAAVSKGNTTDQKLMPTEVRVQTPTTRTKAPTP